MFLGGSENGGRYLGPLSNEVEPSKGGAFVKTSSDRGSPVLVCYDPWMNWSKIRS